MHDLKYKDKVPETDGKWIMYKGNANQSLLIRKKPLA